MKKTLTFRCESCKRSSEVEVDRGLLSCPHCTHPIGKIDKAETLFNQCVICQCRQFYLSKDFNQALGCFVVLIGVVLVPWTYGLSLPAVALIDWILYKRVPTIVTCYRCGSLFKGFEYPKQFKPFSHPTGMQYERFRK